MMDTLRFERRGDIGWLYLTRPERLNAQTLDMWHQLGTLQAGIDRLDPPLRCLVVTGTGRAFSAGVDLDEITPPDGSLVRAATVPGPAGAALLDTIAEVQQTFRWFKETPFPTLAAVHGHALGAGLQLALACDLRLFAEGTVAGILEFRYGLLPDLGGTAFLPAVVGDGVARELIFTGRTFDAAEAARIGLANWVVEAETLEAEATRLAAILAQAPTIACGHSKAALLVAGDVDASLARARLGQAECLRAVGTGADGPPANGAPVVAAVAAGS